MRADRLSCYGYRNLRTPGIDTISQGGTLFWQANAQVPLTLPSHVSLLTSTYPFVNGIEDNGQQLGPNTVTLATILKSRGYATAAFVGGFVLDRRFGLNQGFDFYESSFDLRRRAGGDPGDIKRSGEKVVRFARQWLEADPSAAEAWLEKSELPAETKKQLLTPSPERPKTGTIFPPVR